MTLTHPYCDYCKKLDKNDPNKLYHDNEYGFPIEDNNELFGRLLLEINQAGLSWSIILKKAHNFREAYAGFNLKKVAKFTQEDRNRLLSNTGIIRNRLKVNAAIYNAQQIIGLQKAHGSFKKWLDLNHPLSREEWVKLFKKTFKFTGGEITNEFLLSTGYLKGAHDKNCEVYEKTLSAQPMWNK